MADLHYRITVTSGFFSFTVQNIWKMATIIDKIAYHLCTVCLPAIALRLPLTDTCYKFCQRIQPIHAYETSYTGKTYGKFCCHDCTTMARQPTYLTSPSIASKHDAPMASLHSRALTVPKLKVLLQNHDHHSPILVNSHIQYTSPHNYMHIHNQGQPVHSKRSQNKYYGAWKQDTIVNTSNAPSSLQKLEPFNQNSGLWSLSTAFIDGQLWLQKLMSVFTLYTHVGHW